MHTICTLDFYNSTFYLKFGEAEYIWNDTSKFIFDTNYPYKNVVRLVSYEPERNIFQIERPGGVQASGQDLEEMKWFQDNETRLIPIITKLKEADVYTATMEQTRIQLLYDTDWLVLRHQEQLELNVDTTLTPEKFREVLTYRQLLRNLSNKYSPDTLTNKVTWPKNPLK
jgi:hypothetical protein